MVKESIGKRKKQGEATKKRIMECATALFREKGYNNVTVDEIIEKAGSSKGGFYNHFNSKEELLFNMLSLLDETYLEYLNREEANDNAIEKIINFTEHVFLTIDRLIGLDFISVIYSSQIKDTTFPNFSITPQRVYYRALMRFIEEGKANYLIREDLPTDQVIRILTTTSRGVIYDWCLSRGTFELADYGKYVITIILKGLNKNLKD